MPTLSARAAAPCRRALDEPTLCAAFQHTARERAGELALRAHGGGLALTFAGYAERVRAVTAAQVLEVSRAVLAPAKLVVIVVGPMREIGGGLK
ncbi:MAG TPA: hypothetical protein VFS37_06135, partial [Conexibacter sp.]|nr:hypothetical protein [Conexibacter sp.]